MRAAAATLTLGDLAVLLEAVQRDLRTPPRTRDRYADLLAVVLRCDARSSRALRSLAARAGGHGGLPGEGGLLVAAAARAIAGHDVERDAACAVP